MCHTSVFEFLIESVNLTDFDGKRVLEVGSKYVNGSIRPFIETHMKPKEYVGVDIESGRFVDLVLPAEELVKYFGEESFDIVIATELLEHVSNWRLVINNMKRVVKCGGYVYITTRSKGFRLHSYPYDYWRYDINDIKGIFADFDIVSVCRDREAPGVFLKARKTDTQKSTDLGNIAIHSMVLGKRTNNIQEMGNMPLTRRTMQHFLTSRIRNCLPSILTRRLERRFLE